MATKVNEERVKTIMRNLRVDREQALAIIASDAEVDKGIAQEWDMSPEEHKAAMKYANVTDKKPPKQTTSADGSTPPAPKRTHKPNPTKGGIIQALFEFLRGLGYDDVTVTNAERQIAFSIGGVMFELTLVQKRKPKA